METIFLFLAWQLAAGGPDSPVVVDSTRNLFFDDYIIASKTGVKRTVEQARKFPGNPVLWPAEEWEPPMATLYGSVIRDGDTFKMWYKSGMGVAYAESEDGIAWTKPRLDRVVADGERTNILLRKKSKTEPPPEFPYFYELFGVHRDDRDPDPSRRFKMGFLDIDWKYEGPGGDPWHKGQRRGLGVAGSPDGIHWKLIDNWATEEGSARGRGGVVAIRLVQDVVLGPSRGARRIARLPAMGLREARHRSCCDDSRPSRQAGHRDLLDEGLPVRRDLHRSRPGLPCDARREHPRCADRRRRRPSLLLRRPDVQARALFGPRQGTGEGRDRLRRDDPRRALRPNR